MAGVVITNRKKWSTGKYFQVTGTLTFDSSYPTGGEAVTAATFGLRRLDSLVVDSTGANDFAWDTANAKLKAFVSSSAAEVADTTSLATVAVPFRAIGI